MLFQTSVFIDRIGLEQTFHLGVSTHSIRITPSERSTTRRRLPLRECQKLGGTLQIDWPKFTKHPFIPAACECNGNSRLITSIPVVQVSLLIHRHPECHTLTTHLFSLNTWRCQSPKSSLGWLMVRESVRWVHSSQVPHWLCRFHRNVSIRLVFLSDEFQFKNDEPNGLCRINSTDECHRQNSIMIILGLFHRRATINQFLGPFRLCAPQALTVWRKTFQFNAKNTIHFVEKMTVMSDRVHLLTKKNRNHNRHDGVPRWKHRDEAKTVNKSWLVFDNKQ